MKFKKVMKTMKDKGNDDVGVDDDADDDDGDADEGEDADDFAQRRD